VLKGLMPLMPKALSLAKEIEIVSLKALLTIFFTSRFPQ